MLSELNTRHHTATIRLHNLTHQVPLASTALRRLRGMFFTDYDSLLIVPCNSVHSIGFGRELEVAYLDKTGLVLTVKPLKPWRMHLPVKHACAALEAVPGTFANWQLSPGQHLMFSSQ